MSILNLLADLDDFAATPLSDQQRYNLAYHNRESHPYGSHRGYMWNMLLTEHDSWPDCDTDDEDDEGEPHMSDNGCGISLERVAIVRETLANDTCWWKWQRVLIAYPRFGPFASHHPDYAEFRYYHTWADGTGWGGYITDGTRSFKVDQFGHWGGSAPFTITPCDQIAVTGDLRALTTHEPDTLTY